MPRIVFCFFTVSRTQGFVAASAGDTSKFQAGFRDASAVIWPSHSDGFSA